MQYIFYAIHEAVRFKFTHLSFDDSEIIIKSEVLAIIYG